jgi:hypothetical protein
MLENWLRDRSVIVASKRQRSAMTNGAILPGMGRSAWVRRLKDLVALHIADLGGNQNVSEAERAIIRRAAVIITELERMEKTFALSEGAPGIAELEAYYVSIWLPEPSRCPRPPSVNQMRSTRAKQRPTTGIAWAERLVPLEMPPARVVRDEQDRLRRS